MLRPSERRVPLVQGRTHEALVVFLVLLVPSLLVVPRLLAPRVVRPAARGTPFRPTTVSAAAILCSERRRVSLAASTPIAPAAPGAAIWRFFSGPAGRRSRLLVAVVA